MRTNTMYVRTVCFVFGLYLFMGFGASLGLLAQDFATVHHDQSYLAPSSHHWLGTDIFGRSVLSRSIQATKIALAVGFCSTLIALLIGVSLGLLAGYVGRWVDDVIVWLYTTLDSIPYILLLAAFAFALGQGLTNIFLALGLTSWTTLCKIVRTETLKIKNQEYVLAAFAQGLPTWRIIVFAILPNLMHLVLIQAGVLFVAAIKIEVILSYLGLGLEPGSPSWGLMIDDAKQEITRGIWWNMAAATIFMFGLVLSSNLLIEEFRKKWDKKSSASY